MEEGRQYGRLGERQGGYDVAVAHPNLHLMGAEGAHTGLSRTPPLSHSGSLGPSSLNGGCETK